MVKLYDYNMQLWENYLCVVIVKPLFFSKVLHHSSFYCHHCFSKLPQYRCLSKAYRAAVSSRFEAQNYHHATYICNSISLNCHYCFSKLLTAVSLRRIELQPENAFLLPTPLQFLAVQSAHGACPYLHIRYPQ